MRERWCFLYGGCLLAAGVVLGSSTYAAQDDPARAVSAKASSLAAEEDFAGAVLVAHHGKVLLRQAYGLADRERKIAATPDTQYRLGSMNKMFTAVAILQFVEAGKIGLDDPIGKFLPDYPNRDLSSRVTIRHLLTHTGGTGDIFPEYFQRRSELKEHNDFLKMFGSRPAIFEPGSSQRYSNYGFVLLGAIIERLSGTSYYDHVASKVFAPAGMRYTDSPVGPSSEPRRATGYVKQGTSWVPNTDTLPWRGTAAGGGYSTVDDLMRFAEALQKGTLLSKATVALATAPHRADAPYGLGFLIGGTPTAPAIGHSGGAPGMSAELRWFPASGHIFVALANQGPPGVASVLSREFRQALAPRAQENASLLPSPQ